MPQQLLSKGGRPTRQRPSLTVVGEMELALSRVHELCGTARRTLAALVAMQMDGPVVWIAPAWRSERINGDGLFPLVAPGRVVFVHATRPEDLLWCMEEALGSGAVPLVVTELPAPPALTPVRRLHLAAERGTNVAGLRPLGVLLTEGEGGAAGVESRWALEGTHQVETPSRWRLERLRDRAAPPKQWHVHRKNGAFSMAPIVSSVAVA